MMKRGSILIEDIISLFLILIFITTSLFIFKNMLKTINKREILSNINRSIYVLESEMKYNKPFNEVKEQLENNFYLKYNNNFLKNVKKADLFSMDKNIKDNEYLELKIVEEGLTYIKIRITISFQGNYVEKEFNKGIWMDEM